ncbi:TRAP transporter small permease [Desulfuribacillus alkaliarsenatis]|uniref:Tripartite ATP-independent periplasmic transporters DctQ component domain-containing protein n=1 Tax=Desulfuribacillus alkaliarsenatis TaxID=766136 RepID=A0A1E5G4Y4_9FIRM|nr:TRAP transporter small permease [Desulfuribacillus alkaliarsenatis]OEF98240.1 hypothetical protein BHF68_00715 [Desulfuribacillus alkaliarsenatis]
MKYLNQLAGTISTRLSQIAQIALVAVMLLIVSNIILRRIWKPIPGTVELVEILGAVILGTSVAYCLYKKGHIFVNVFVRNLSFRKQAAIDIFTNVLSITATSLLTWQTFVYGNRMMNRGLATGQLEIPLWPIIYLVGIGFAVVVLVLANNLLTAYINLRKGEEQ